jgi:cytochrome b pre-mRNA-processing protein 3
MGLLKRLFGPTDDGRGALRTLYSAVVAEARNPAWFQDGGVADSLDGRFDMIAAVLALVIVRLEQDGAMGADHAARLTELFVDDMDPQLREIGIGDMVVGKHIGRMMSALGGRLTAYRDAVAGDGSLEQALVRNLYRGEAPAPTALSFAVARLHALNNQISAAPVSGLLVRGWAAA